MGLGRNASSSVSAAILEEELYGDYSAKTDEECPGFMINTFTSRRFKGSPTGVCFFPAAETEAEVAWPAPELMLKIAEENNVSETAFCIRGE